MPTRIPRPAWALLALLAAGTLAACEIITSTDEGKLIEPTIEAPDGGAPDGATDGGDSGVDGG